MHSINLIGESKKKRAAVFVFFLLYLDTSRFNEIFYHHVTVFWLLTSSLFL